MNIPDYELPRAERSFISNYNDREVLVAVADTIMAQRLVDGHCRRKIRNHLRNGDLYHATLWMKKSGADVVAFRHAATLLGI